MSKRSSDGHEVGRAAGRRSDPTGHALRPLPPALRPEEESSELAAESIGRYLSQQRRLRGISVDQLAESTRIPKRSIERLEAGHFDQDIDGFVRGFVRTVADGLGLDPQDTLARMLAEPRGHSERGHSMSTLLGRSLVGLVVVTTIALAFGVVRAVWQAGGATETSRSPEAVVWRSDPVRTLAEAHAAGAGSVADARPPARPAE